MDLARFYIGVTQLTPNPFLQHNANAKTQVCQEEAMEMNPPRCDDLDYIHFLIAAQKVFTCTEASRCQPEREDAPAHDAFTRLLSREPPDTEALWQEAKAFVDKKWTKRGGFWS